MKLLLQCTTFCSCDDMRRGRKLHLIPLLRCIHEGPKLPFYVCLCLLQRSLADLVWPHLKTRTNLGQLYLTVRGLDKDVMSAGKNKYTLGTLQ